MPRAQIIVASCSRRSLEVEQLRNFLEGNGYEVAKDDWETDRTADKIILSTCGFTRAAEDFAFELYDRVSKEKKDGAEIIIGGCIPETNPERLKSVFGGSSFSPKNFNKINDAISPEHPIEEFRRPNTINYARQKSHSLASEAGKAFNLLKTFDGSISSAKYISRRISNGVNKRLIRNNLVHLNSQDFFYIQIQEGCSMQCSYCSIKDAIGPLRSRPMAEILDEFNSGLVRGFRNFQFMGDNAGSYGLDNNQSFSELLQKVSEIDGEFIVELTDINPVYLKRIAPGVKSLIEKKRLSSLYVPIQSGSERILRQMKRGSNMSQAKSILRGFREAGSGRFRMGTSVIVGYPGETMEELMSTISFCREARFDWIWCHSFSAQPNQPAAEANDMLPAEEIMNRARLLKGMLSKQAVVTAAEDTRGSRTCQG